MVSCAPICVRDITETTYLFFNAVLSTESEHLDLLLLPNPVSAIHGLQQQKLLLITAVSVRKEKGESFSFSVTERERSQSQTHLSALQHRRNFDLYRALATNDNHNDSHNGHQTKEEG